MRLLPATLVGLVTLFSFGCGGSDSYKTREADPAVNDEVLVDDPAMARDNAKEPRTRK